MASSMDAARALVGNVATVLEGKSQVVELACATLLARGHLLLEDVPGTGKTTLAKALARSVGLDTYAGARAHARNDDEEPSGFRRVQFTSDMLPSDLLGVTVLDPREGRFVFRPGPIFTHVLLADEINRTTPKTQSALLEAMNERQVSVDGTTHPLEEPFFVVATQNPRDFYGTYPLPESQLDRFLLRLRIGYPSEQIERRLLATRGRVDPLDELSAVLSREELLATQDAVERVRMETTLLDYVHRIVIATRSSPLLDLGASTRAALDFVHAARAIALVRERSYVLPDDVKQLAVHVLAHRVRMAGGDGSLDTVGAERIVRDLVSRIPVPV
ncbi:MAG: AAA family ATPase [Deltaproteobacteria bacterium]|nr:AAA family ATPase [Deltaproteobacteria bacterium]